MCKTTNCCFSILLLTTNDTRKIAMVRPMQTGIYKEYNVTYVIASLLPSKRCQYDARAAPTTEVTSQRSFGAHRYRVRRKCQKGRGEIVTNACEVFGCEHVPSHVTKVPPDSAERLFFSERWLAKVSSEFYNFSTFKL